MKGYGMTTRFTISMILTFVALSMSAMPIPELEERAARGREESLQGVPISETYFSAREIEDARIETVLDFIELAPNVTSNQFQNAGQSSTVIRGMTQVRNNEAPMAVVVDGVLMISPNQFTQDLFSVESIEVVRGPQGALFGRNATGGAMIITTRSPSTVPEGYVRLGIGEGNEFLTEAGVSGPLSDVLSYRVAAKVSKRDGYYRNVTLDTEADPAESRQVRAQLRWIPNDLSLLDVKLSVNESSGGTLNFWLQPTLVNSDGTLDLENLFAGTELGADLVQTEFYANNRGINEREILEVSANYELLGDWGRFQSITSITSLEEFFGGDQVPYTRSTTASLGFAGLDGTQSQFVDWQAWSQEFRLSSPTDRRLRVMGGVYYLDLKRFVGSATGADTGQGIRRVERAPLTDQANPTLTFFADDNENSAWAAFANLTYDISDRLEAYVGLRYDSDERNQFVSPLQTGFPPGVGKPGAENTRTFSKLQPKLSLRYAANDRFSVYGSWGRGFRSGQFNQNGVGAFVEGAGDFADQEVSESTELGFKSQSSDGRFRLNGAVFQTDVEGQHYFLFVGDVGAQITINIDQVDLRGGEFEFAARVTEGFDIYAALGIIDSEIEEYVFNPAAVGNKAPFISDYTFNIGAQVRRPLSPAMDFSGRIDFSRLGDRAWDPENTATSSEIDLLSTRLAFEFANGKWVAAISGRNLLDTEYNSDVVGDGGFFIFTHPAPPRTWALDLIRRF